MDTETPDFFCEVLGVPNVLWTRHPEILDVYAWPVPYECDHRFADSIPRYVETLHHLSTTGEIVEVVVSVI